VDRGRGAGVYSFGSGNAIGFMNFHLRNVKIMWVYLKLEHLQGNHFHLVSPICSLNQAAIAYERS
jgi:hypothetical protein